jgi:putative ABC transport system substrate-binding protein
MSRTRTCLNRRQLVQGMGAAGLALMVGCSRSAAQTPPARIPRVGLLGLLTVPSLPEAFRQGLRELGYIEGQNIVVEHRVADGRPDRLAELATELVRMPADVIVAESTLAAIEAKQATSTIPIVMPVGDPIGAGLAASLARPGGNVTGLTSIPAQLAGRRLELLKEIIPGLRQVAVVWNPGSPVKAQQWIETESAARTLGIQLQSVEVRVPEELEPAFTSLSQQPPDALNVFAYEVTTSHAGRVVELVTRSGVPAIYETRPFMDVGGLISYGPSAPGQFRRAAYYVDRILKGARPEDLPIEQPREFDFLVNLRAARALGLTIPPHVLAQATEVLQ